MEKIAVIGGGSWGTALAIAMTRARAQHAVALWVHEPDICDTIRRKRVNEVFLPGFEIPAAVEPTSDQKIWRCRPTRTFSSTVSPGKS